MKKVFAALACLFIALDGMAKVSLTYDHSANKLTCPGGASTDGSCVVTLHEGEILTIQVTNSVPGLFDMSVQKTDQPAEVAPPAFVTAARLSPAQSQATSPQPHTNAAELEFNEFRTPTGATVTDAYNAFVAALARLEQSLRNDLSRYPTALSAVRNARADLLAAIQPTADDPLAVAKTVLSRLKEEKSTVSVTEGDLGDVWSKLGKFLRSAPAGLGDLAPQVFHYVDRDFDLAVDVKPTFDLFTIPARRVVAVVQLSDPWVLRTTTGIALSGLYDEHYTRRTFIDTPASGTTPAVTHQEVVRERRDAAYPEATMFLHIAKVGRHDALSLGAGVATGNAAARLYIGYSHRLAMAAAWSVGIAGGNVKRLSNSIDIKNPGNADPEQSRHDAFKFAPFVCVSVRIGGAPQ